MVVTIELVRARDHRVQQLVVARGSLVRDALRQAGLPPEGSAVLVGGVSIPLDTPLELPIRLSVVPTFSGG